MMTILLTLLVVGIVLWMINSFVLMDGKIKTILNVVVVLFTLMWLIRHFAFF